MRAQFDLSENLRRDSVFKTDQKARRVTNGHGGDESRQRSVNCADDRDIGTLVGWSWLVAIIGGQPAFEDGAQLLDSLRNGSGRRLVVLFAPGRWRVECRTERARSDGTPGQTPFMANDPLAPKQFFRRGRRTQQVDGNVRVPRPQPGNAPNPLLQARGSPGKVEVNDSVGVLEIDSFTEKVRRQQLLDDIRRR